jgi:hypothetical protein
LTSLRIDTPIGMASLDGAGASNGGINVWV